MPGSQGGGRQGAGKRPEMGKGRAGLGRAGLGWAGRGRGSAVETPYSGGGNEASELPAWERACCCPEGCRVGEGGDATEGISPGSHFGREGGLGGQKAIVTLSLSYSLPPPRLIWSYVAWVFLCIYLF